MRIPTIESERLVLRGFEKSDATDVQALAGAFEIADTTTIPHPYEDGAAEAWIDRHHDAFVSRRAVTFAMTFKKDKTLMGAISLMNIEEDHQAELGYWLGLPYWGKGFCTEAGKRVMAYAFSDLGLVRLHARHLTRNASSGRVLQKIGFIHEGSRTGHVKKWGKLEDVEDYGLMRKGDSY